MPPGIKNLLKYGVKNIYASVFALGSLDILERVTIIKPCDSAAALMGLRRGALIERRDAE